MATTEEIHRAVGRLEAKVDILLERGKESDKDADALAERVSKLEHGATASKAVLGFVSVVAGGASALLTKFFGGT